jgi:TfoX/Sxy family transcriptional regulator of competence genes
MSERGDDHQQALAAVAAAFSSNREVTSGGRGFGSSGLKVKGKLFALVSSRGEFVVKLPRQRVQELVAAGAGQYFDAGRGRPMREWLAIQPGADADFLSLAREAHRYAGGVEG